MKISIYTNMKILMLSFIFFWVVNFPSASLAIETIKIIATKSPHMEILEFIKKDIVHLINTTRWKN